MPDGLVIIDKPQGWTSMDVCAKIRGIFHVRRVGHAGTLDPMATGVLPVFVGQATKAIRFAEGGKKEYCATVRFGVTTDTQDTEGNVLSTTDASVSEDMLRAVLPRFLGEIEQIPPMYSAIKIHGQKLCDLARKGQTVERPARRITVFSIDDVQKIEHNLFSLRVVCSKGTYIRTLCHDIGAALGCGGAMASLRRTGAAGFSIAEAVTMDDLIRRGEELLRPTDSLFRDLPRYTVSDAEQERRLRCGNPIRAAVPDGKYRIYGENETFLAISDAKSGVLTAEQNFFGGQG